MQLIERFYTIRSNWTEFITASLKECLSVFFSGTPVYPTNETLPRYDGNIVLNDIIKTHISKSKLCVRLFRIRKSRSSPTPHTTSSEVLDFTAINRKIIGLVEIRSNRNIPSLFLVN